MGGEEGERRAGVGDVVRVEEQRPLYNCQSIMRAEDDLLVVTCERGSNDIAEHWLGCGKTESGGGDIPRHSTAYLHSTSKGTP